MCWRQSLVRITGLDKDYTKHKLPPRPRNKKVKAPQPQRRGSEDVRGPRPRTTSFCPCENEWLTKPARSPTSDPFRVEHKFDQWHSDTSGLSEPSSRGPHKDANTISPWQVLATMHASENDWRTISAPKNWCSAVSYSMICLILDRTTASPYSERSLMTRDSSGVTPK